MVKTERRRQRALSSEKRAGSWLRRRALEEQYRLIRENPRIPLILLVLYLVMLPLAWTQPGAFRGFFIGAWTASVVWMGVLATWQLSGVAPFQQGELAERWTVQELRSLTKSGEWQLINHVLFRPWDIDHILIGPAGVIVIETKGGNSDWTEPKHEPRIQDAVRQVSGNAGDTRRFIRPDIGPAPVLAVVALWPARKALPTRNIDGVTVLSGDHLQEWVESLPTDQLSAEAAAAAWRRIADHLDRRDAHDIEMQGRPPRTLNRLAFDFAQYPVGGLLGAALAAPVFGLPYPSNLIAVLTIIGLTIAATRRLPVLRRVFTGFALGLAAMTAAVAVIALVDHVG
jgi:hypothetical protein